nr:MobA/MobL family protein [Loktanella sp. M215]
MPASGSWPCRQISRWRAGPPRARDFARALVDRYGIARDVALHAPHREGDQRNHHAHILTTTRVLSADGLTDKTRILDAAKTGGAEIEECAASGRRWESCP